MSETNLILAGVGGQGIVLASRLIAHAALQAGLMVRTSETIGMAQRGGSVVSHLRLGDDVQSPRLPFSSATAIIGFEPAEAARNLHYLAPGGTVIISAAPVRPVTSSLGNDAYDAAAVIDFLRRRVRRLVVVDGETLCAAAGSTKVLNVGLLGAAAAAGVLGIDRDQLAAAVTALLRPKLVAVNLAALDAGAATTSTLGEEASA